MAILSVFFSIFDLSEWNKIDKVLNAFCRWVCFFSHHCFHLNIFVFFHCFSFFFVCLFIFLKSCRQELLCFSSFTLFMFHSFLLHFHFFHFFLFSFTFFLLFSFHGRFFSNLFSHLYKRVCPSVRPSIGHKRVEFQRNGLNLNRIASGTWNYAIRKTIQRQVRGQIVRTHICSTGFICCCSFSRCAPSELR